MYATYTILTRVVSACGRLYDSAFAEASDGVLLFPPDLYNQISGEKEEERKAVQKRFTFSACSFSETCPTLSEFDGSYSGGNGSCPIVHLKRCLFSINQP